MAPLANAYLSSDQLLEEESFYPLKVYLCERCFLVQIPDSEPPHVIFDDEYGYFASYSDSWLRHCQAYVDEVTSRFHLNPDARVVEVASNDGYLLQYFLERGFEVLGIEPASNVADAAIERGIPTRKEFFGTEVAKSLASEGLQADVLIGNNVLAHVPDINDFVGGLKVLLAPEGIITMEFPHLLNLIEKKEFDTIYHEHFSYLSFSAVKKIFEQNGIDIFDVEELPTHGGSLRVFAHHAEDDVHQVTGRVDSLIDVERRYGLTARSAFEEFASEVESIKRDVLRFLIESKEAGKQIVGYGAAAKGNTLFNYCGIRTDFIDYIADRSPHKQGKFLPGTHIPIYAPDRIYETQPDYVVVSAWNLLEEIMMQLQEVRTWGGEFITFIPSVTKHAPSKEFYLESK